MHNLGRVRTGNFTGFLGTAVGNATFNSCCIKSDSTLQGSWFKNDPLFINFSEDDYHLSSGSPCINSGTDISGVNIDLDGNSRIAGSYDIGAYEKQ